MTMLDLQGEIKDAARCSPVVNARVCALSGDAVAAEARSDERGHWSLTVPSSCSSVTVSRAGFGTRTYDVRNVPPLVRLIRDDIVGYQPQLWFSPGDTIPVSVHSPSAYQVSLFRHGRDRVLVMEIGEQPASPRVVPDGYFVEQGLDWPPSFTYQLPESAQPGLYSLRLKTQASEFSVPLIVSTPRGSHGAGSKLLVVASTNTWQSYNIWGGRSRYRNFEDTVSREFIPLARLTNLVRRVLPNRIRQALSEKLAPRPWMFRRLSIRRPYAHSGLDGDSPEQPFANHLAGGEWRVLAWLEREGIPYDIVSGCELHRAPDLLRHYQAVLFNTHCEYWTREMYEGLQRFHEEQGGWILNIGGNSIFREIVFDDDGSSRCVSLYFSASCADESQVLGVRFSMSDYAECAPYRVVEPTSWVFEGTGLDAGALFGQKTLNGHVARPSSEYVPSQPGARGGLKGEGASGWETDKLTATAPSDFQVVAKGANRGGGADMVLREPSGSRGGVFSVSSILFGGALLVDETCSRIVRNAVDRALGD